MPRPPKIGIDYYPTDVGIVGNIKVQKLLRYHKGPAALGVLIALFSQIYNHGYYLNWDDDQRFVLSKDLYVEEEYIQEIIDACLGMGTFDKELFAVHKILTSRGIQQRYFLATNRRKQEIHTLPYIYPSIMKEVSKQFAKGEFLHSKTELMHAGTKLMHTESTQSKVKESKVNTSVGTTLRSVPLSSDEPMTGDRIDFLAFQDFFNRTMQEHDAQIPTVTLIGQKRRAAVNARLKEHGKDALRTAIVNAATSAFLNGAGEQCFVASFDWIFRPTNFVKVLEGNYNHESTPKNSNNYGKGQQKTARERIEEELAEGEEYFNGMLARNEASLHSNVPAKVWEH